MSPAQFQMFLVVMQSLPVIAVGFPPGCPTAAKAAVPPHCLAPPWLPELSQHLELLEEVCSSVSLSVSDNLKFSLSPWEHGWSPSSDGHLVLALQLGDGTVCLHPLPKGFLSHLPDVLLPNRRDLHPVKRQ